MLFWTKTGKVDENCRLCLKIKASISAKGRSCGGSGFGGRWADDSSTWVCNGGLSLHLYECQWPPLNVISDSHEGHWLDPSHQYTPPYVLVPTDPLDCTSHVQSGECIQLIDRYPTAEHRLETLLWHAAFGGEYTAAIESWTLSQRKHWDSRLSWCLTNSSWLLNKSQYGWGVIDDLHSGHCFRFRWGRLRAPT